MAALETWAEGASYERYVGRWSRLAARELLAWLEPPRGRRWLDVGCGTGALAEAILAHASPAQVVGIDRSPGFVEHARARVRSDAARFEVGDAQSLAVPDAGFDVAVSGLVLNFVADPPGAMREMVRAVRPGGTVAVYLWDYAGRMEMMRHFWDAAVALDPDAARLDEGVRFPLCREDALAALARDAGLARVETRALDVPTRFADFEDFWSPFLGGQGPAPTYAVSLAEDARARLRERVRASLPIGADGSIELIGRAWAVRGERPPRA